MVSTIDVGTMWDRMLGEFLGEYERLSRSRMSTSQLDAALDAFMDDLSETPAQVLARTSSSVAYNQGRSAEILTAHEEGAVQFVVRSEVLDPKSTCATCWTLDSKVVEVGTPDYYAFEPPLLCEGRDRCRGLYIPVTGEGLG